MNQQAALKRLIVNAPAKINLFLELLHKREDGFHELATVMSTVSLYDTLSFTLRDDQEIRLAVDATDSNVSAIEDIPTGESNLVYRAAKAVRHLALDRSSSSTPNLGVDIQLLKRIPSSAGLGGASSDAAATIVATNRLWSVGLKRQQMIDLAAELGSDVPFFLFGGMALCEGRGEIISPIGCPVGTWVVIGKPGIGLSTGSVFSKVSIKKTRWSVADLQYVLKTGNVRQIGQQMRNRLQEVAFSICADKSSNELETLQREFSLPGCRGHQMSGSGSSYFGLFDSQQTARRAANRLANVCPSMQFFSCRTLGPNEALAA